METTVVNLYELERQKVDWENDPSYVYCGRPGKGRPGPWGNPHVIGMVCPFCYNNGKIIVHKRGETLELYKHWFYNKLKWSPGFKAKVETLRGKKLVCFCVSSVTVGRIVCHAQVIAEYLNSTEKGGE